MDDTDAFFTQTIVGAPFSVQLGRELKPDQLSAHGLEAHLQRDQTRLSRAWQDWIALCHASHRTGQPRRLPSQVQQWLERRALPLALLGVLGLGLSAVSWGLMLWK